MTNAIPYMLLSQTDGRGDRFIPHRQAVDMDMARFSHAERPQPSGTPVQFKVSYDQLSHCRRTALDKHQSALISVCTDMLAVVPYALTLAQSSQVLIHAVFACLAGELPSPAGRQPSR